MLFPAPGASPLDWHLLFNPLDLPQLAGAAGVLGLGPPAPAHPRRSDRRRRGLPVTECHRPAQPGDRTATCRGTQSELFASDKVQTALAILWTLGGVVSMALSRRHASRSLWIGGAVLLGLTVLKLFLVDLGNSGTLERIVSFISVGLLLLVIGYIAPLPPQRDEP